MGQADPRESAKIYDLAVFRRAQAARRSTPPARVPTVSTGAAWYHEAAIREDERNRDGR